MCLSHIIILLFQLLSTLGQIIIIAIYNIHQLRANRDSSEADGVVIVLVYYNYIFKRTSIWSRGGGGGHAQTKQLNEVVQYKTACVELSFTCPML